MYLSSNRQCGHTTTYCLTCHHVGCDSSSCDNWMSTFGECPVCGGSNIVFMEEYQRDKEFQEIEDQQAKERKEEEYKKKMKQLEDAISNTHRIATKGREQVSFDEYGHRTSSTGFPWKTSLVFMICFLINLTGLHYKEVEGTGLKIAVFVINMAGGVVELILMLIKSIFLAIFN
jgi:hypothetical protein